MKYHVYCPSYKRPQIAITHKLFLKDRFSYVIREEEKNLYKKLNVDLKIIPKGKVTNISDTRNWILDNRESEAIVMVDDDMKNIYWNIERKPSPLKMEHLDHIISNMFDMCESMNIRLWGMNINTDPSCYRIYNPFSFSSVILGPFTAHLKPNSRYDISLPLKEDYDFFMQEMVKTGKALRANFLSYDVDHQKLQGGCQTYRNDEREKEQMKLFLKKWKHLGVQENNRKDRQGSINPIIKKMSKGI